MELQTKTGQTVARVHLSGEKGKPLHAMLEMGGKKVELPGVDLSFTKEDGKLVGHVLVPGMTDCRLALEADDVKVLKGLMNKDALGFMMSAFLKG